MTYVVKEVFATLQGEGAHAGRAAVFCRFSRCNLWTGHEEHRSTAVCQFCDTDFVGTDGPGGESPVHYDSALGYDQDRHFGLKHQPDLNSRNALRN